MTPSEAWRHYVDLHFSPKAKSARRQETRTPSSHSAFCISTPDSSSDKHFEAHRLTVHSISQRTTGIGTCRRTVAQPTFWYPFTLHPSPLVSSRDPVSSIDCNTKSIQTPPDPPDLNPLARSSRALKLFRPILRAAKPEPCSPTLPLRSQPNLPVVSNSSSARNRR